MPTFEPAVICFARGTNEGLIILWWCQACNSRVDVTQLVHRLCGYGLENCPEKLYQAWKILRLGTTDYRNANNDPEFEHRIITNAQKETTETCTRTLHFKGGIHHCVAELGHAPDRHLFELADVDTRIT